MNTPLVSVIMPVFNSQDYVCQAIQSILNQTYTHFEFLIFDDGSTDNSLAIIQSFDDSRIQFFSDGTNKGQPARYNAGIQTAKGKYIAIAHADDEALPYRLAETVAFLEENEDYEIVGSRVAYIDNQGNSKERIYGKAGDHNFLFLHGLIACPLMHATILARKSLFLKYPYHLDFDSCEDYELFSRLSYEQRMFNISKPLVHYRLHETNLTKTKQDRHEANIKFLMKNQYAALNLTYTEKDFQAHLLTFYFYRIHLDFTELKMVEAWLIRLKNELLSLRRFHEADINHVIYFNWYLTCMKGRGTGRKLLPLFRKSQLFDRSYNNFRENLTIVLLSLPFHDRINRFYTWVRKRLR
ncbi:MAG: glycosyltransferase [Bacteroidota bacterium]